MVKCLLRKNWLKKQNVNNNDIMIVQVKDCYYKNWISLGKFQGKHFCISENNALNKTESKRKMF